MAARLQVRGGALVQTVLSGSAAEKAGVLATRRGLAGIITGDIIVGVSDSGIYRPAQGAALWDALHEGVAQMREVFLVGGCSCSWRPEQAL